MRFFLILIFLHVINFVISDMPFQKGMTFAGGRWCPQVRYDSNLSSLSLRKLHATGADSVAILVTHFQFNVNTTDIFPIKDGTNTDQELRYSSSNFLISMPSDES
jgi:hypothetical protein